MVYIHPPKTKFTIPYFYLEKELLAMVREVSEDKMYDTIEFNEFLTMIGKQSQTPITKESLVEAFK